MKISRLGSLAVLACLAVAPAGATSEHNYGRNEYLVVQNGLAPNKQLSVAAHGEGEGGHDAFRVWLMAEPAHRKIAALADISEDNNLDTDPSAYHAFWSKDSRHVGIGFRSSRHEITLNLYNVDGRSARLLVGPSLFHEATGRDVKDEDGLRTVNSVVEWHDGNRFRLREVRSFVADDDSVAKLAGKYGRVSEKLPEGRLVIQFSADSECEILPDDRYRVVNLQPGKPGDGDDF